MYSSATMALKAPMAPDPAGDAFKALFPSPRSEANEPLTSLGATIRNRPVTWVEPEEPFWRLTIKNIGLTLATFGVWHFWGRAEARRQLANAVRIDGRPLDYTGSGKEAFLGFLVAATMVVTVTVAMLSMLQIGKGGGGPGIQELRWNRLFITLPLLFLLGSAAYRRRHHVLKRTWLDGERFRLTGHPWAYARQHFWSAFLVGVTLGWAAPWRSSRLEARKIGEMAYGTQRFVAKPDLGRLYKAFALLWFGGGVIYVATLIVLARYIGPEILAAVQGLTLAPLSDPGVARTGLTIIGIGMIPVVLSLLNYRTAWIEHRINAVAIPTGGFRLALPRLGFLWLTLTNAALLIGSLGLMGPVAEARTVRYIVDHLEVEGRLALDPTG